jgi:hypothetical protein
LPKYEHQGLDRLRYERIVNSPRSYIDQLYLLPFRICASSALVDRIHLSILW